MARGGINRAVVRIARDALLARGVRPSIDAVRVELGNTGSKTTIQRYLSELRDVDAPPAAMGLNDELAHYVASLVERLKRQAQDALAEDRALFEQDQAEARQQRDLYQLRHDQLQAAHETLLKAREDGVRNEESLGNQLRVRELELQRLMEAQLQQQRLLEERAAQISSLEDKHRFARDALEHYRAQHLLQRDQEIKRHDQQLQLLQREAHEAREKQLVAQQELSQLYRDLERMNGEQLRHHQECQRLERALHSTKDSLRSSETARSNQTRQLQAMIEERAALREAVRQSLLRHREDRRLLRSFHEKQKNADEQQADQN